MSTNAVVNSTAPSYDQFESIVEIGAVCSTGSYLLRIQVLQPLSVVFGRFLSGQPLAIPAGEYVYVGSAMGQCCHPALARRTVRHATRGGSLPAHHIRRLLLHHYQNQGWPANKITPRTGKRTFWHIDYLLDEQTTNIAQVYLIYSERRTESAVAEYLEKHANTITIQTGLGARDRPGHSHFLSVRGAEDWWSELPSVLAPLAKPNRSGMTRP